MDTHILDAITNAFVHAIQGGTATLSALSIPLLGVFAILAFYLQVGPLVASGAGGVGDAVASVLLTVLKAGAFYWLLVNFVPISTAAFQTFLQWGAAVGDVSQGTFLTPSAVIDVGFRIATPIRDF